MPTIDENAVTILRVMLENGMLRGHDKGARDILEISRLDEVAFGMADHYLVEAGFVKGTFGGAQDNAGRWLTAQGITFIRTEMAGRLPLSLTAERILRHMVNVAPRHGMHAMRMNMIPALNLDAKTYEDACQELENFDLITYGGMTGEFFGMIAPSRKGRQAVQQNFRRDDAPTTQIQTGAVIQGDVVGSNIQAIATAFQSQIEQTISRNDSETLRSTITQLTEKLVSIVNDELTLDQKLEYTQAAVDLQKEVSKPAPEISTIQRLLAILGFAATLSGTLDLGQKALELNVRVGPVLYSLSQAILQLLKMMQN